MTDPRVLDGLHEEGRETLERQMRTGEDLDSKASDLLRFNAILIGVVVSAMALTLRSGLDVPSLPVWLVGVAGTGVALVGLSTLLSILAYEVTEYGVGLRTRSLRGILGDDPGPQEFQERLVRTYADIIEGNRTPLDKTADRLKLALWTLLAGLAFLGLAAGGFMYIAI